MKFGPALVLALGALAAGPAFAQDWGSDSGGLPVPPTAQARQSELSAGLRALTPVERLKPLSVTDDSGVRISARVARKGTGDALLWELRWEPGAPWGAGTWVAFRDGLGRLREVRIILLEGTDAADHKLAQAGTWIRLVPQARGSRLDLFLAGRLVTGGWSVPGSLLDILDSPDSWLWDVTAEHLDWGSILPQQRWEDEKIDALRVRIHKSLSTMPTAPATLWWPDPKSGPAGTAGSGAPWGRWGSLPGTEGEATRGLGPWGVTLWVATGVIRGWKGGFPSAEALLVPRVSLPGYSQALVRDNLTEDPGFALDWIRNLGLAAFSQIHPQRPLTDDAADVTGLPFLDPVPAAGFGLEEFAAVAHLLAVTRPGQVYLAAVSTQTVGAKGAAASVSFQAPAVVLPWVGADHRVRVAVYAGPEELTWDQWLSRLPAPRKGVRPDHVALVALPLAATVELPVLPAR